MLYKIATPKSSTVVDNSQAARVLQKTSESDATMDDYKEEDVDDELSGKYVLLMFQPYFFILCTRFHTIHMCHHRFVVQAPKNL